jgi:hypothetical protein
MLGDGYVWLYEKCLIKNDLKLLKLLLDESNIDLLQGDYILNKMNERFHLDSISLFKLVLNHKKCDDANPIMLYKLFKRYSSCGFYDCCKVIMNHKNFNPREYLEYILNN